MLLNACSNDAFDAETGVDKSKAESVVNLTGNRKAVLAVANGFLLAGGLLLHTATKLAVSCTTLKHSILRPCKRLILHVKAARVESSLCEGKFRRMHGTCSEGW